MKRVSVQSSNLSSVGYDPNTMILEIEFHDRRIYQFSEVPASCFSGLMNAPSLGKFFARHIKGNYPFRNL
jgi:hypothetical protein